MDSTHFLANQAFSNNKSDRATADEIDAFYAQHGSDHFASAARWFDNRLRSLQNLRIWQHRLPDFARIQQKG